MSPAQTVSKVFAFRQGADSAYGPLYVTPAQGRDGDLYGTTAGDRYPTNLGDIFRVSTSGVGTTLYNFSGTAESYPSYGLILATDGNFYGTVGGGSANLGALFRITPDGVYTVVYNFQGLDDGAYPAYSPIQASDGNLYGAAGGVYGQNDGTIYKYSAAGSITTVFALSADGTQGNYFSSPPIQGADSNLYATTSEGGAFGCGTILKLNTAGVLLQQYDFRCKKYGASPTGLMQASDGNFYGTTQEGGINTTGCYAGCGTVFKMTQSGVVTLLHKFGNSHDYDGAYPLSGLVEGTDGNLYGSTEDGGYSEGRDGTLYMITTSGTETVLGHFYSGDPAGHTPFGSLMQHTNGKFYGTTYEGGLLSGGTVYSLDMGLGPFITFVQATGKIGQTAQILGQGLTGTTSVTFNGVSAASFAVNSDTSMTAVVPAGATTGAVVVITPSGTLTSNRSFRVSQ